jgi:putative membrane protein insertion efficiency factor
MSGLLLVVLRVYQRLVSPLLVVLFGPACRFEPSCSKYAAACIRDHGALRGSLLSAKRLCKCHPLHPGGWDPPPPPLPR